MPVILEPADWLVWLGEVEDDPTALLHPSPEGTLRMWPVSRQVNTPRNNTADLLDPIAGAQSILAFTQDAPAHGAGAAS
jgi:putative SOS response-associated peptidase YedK